MAHRSTDLRLEERVPAGGGSQRFPYAPGLFLALFLSIALLFAVTNPALLESPERPLLDGSWAEAYQQSFDRESHLFAPATTVWGVIEYVLFGQGRPGVLVGEDGWLYSSEEFAYPSDPAEAAANLSANLDAIAAVEERLAARGIDLVVALLPAKARVHPEHLGRFELPAGPHARYAAALEGLEQRGVNVTDLLPPLLAVKERGPAFLRTDTHWTPSGARAAARTVAQDISGPGDVAWLGQEEYATSLSRTVAHRGDLSTFLPLGPFYDELGPADDTLPLYTTSASGSAGSDLFAPVRIPVTLVGTSYSRDERWNFAGWLRQALGSDVLVAAQRGQGPFAPMLDYLEGEAIESAPPRLVVWEVPERYLDQPWRGGEEEK